MKNKITIIFVVGFLMIIYALIGLTNYWISRQQSRLITSESKTVKVNIEQTSEQKFHRKKYGVDIFPPQIDPANDPLKPMVVRVQKQEPAQESDDSSEKHYEFSLESDVLVQ